MMVCHCVHCHSVMHCVAIRYGLPIGWICSNCHLLWQPDIGWNPHTERFDPELLVPRYA